MKRLAGLCVALSLVMLWGMPAGADEKPAQDAPKAKTQKPEAKKAANRRANRQKRASLAENTLKKLEGLDLSDEQKSQIKTLAAEVEPKLQQARQKVNALIPQEQRQARRQALAKARAEGKKPAEVTAFKPTEEQAAAQKEVRQLQRAFNQKVNQVLTREQRQMLRENRQKDAAAKQAAEKKPEAPKTE